MMQWSNYKMWSPSTTCRDVQGSLGHLAGIRKFDNQQYSLENSSDSLHTSILEWWPYSTEGYDLHRVVTMLFASGASSPILQ